MGIHSSVRTLNVISFIAACVAAPNAQAQNPSVSQPGGINLGVTSFFDGFSGPPGWAWLPNVRYTHFEAIRDSNGGKIPAFNDPSINSTVIANQFAYTFEGKIGGWTPAVMVLVPTAKVDASFGPGPALQTPSSGVGDILVGASLQAPPVMGAAGPVFAQRVEADFLLPTGHYSRNSDINYSSGFVSFNPYWAATFLPTPKWEVSWRLHYLYNFKNDKPASSQPGGALFNGGRLANTQAGQASWLNFATSYAITPELNVGINGYYFKQITDSRANGVKLPGSREQVFGIGPGLMWKWGKDKILWVNAYRESMVRNRASADLLLNLRMAIAF